MRVGDKSYQSIWINESDSSVVMAIDQQKLPFLFNIKELRSVDDIYNAIKDLTVRGAPSIGAAGAFGLYLATLEINSMTNIKDHISNAARYLVSCRPTAVNLAWAVNYSLARLNSRLSPSELQEIALGTATEICEMEKENCRRIGKFGLELIESISRKKNGDPVNILTHCNAGWLACVDYGTVTAPIFFAHDNGIPVHVWVDETRPRNQGARLTAWELQQYGVPHTLIPDNAGGHLMQHGKVDLVLTGSDRTTRTGDVANKIGTYLKAVAAFDNNVPFYCALPSTTIDFNISDGVREIPVEERDPQEVTSIEGFDGGRIQTLRLCPENTVAANFGFDVTPARLITGLITEKGICKADEISIMEMFSEKVPGKDS